MSLFSNPLCKSFAASRLLLCAVAASALLALPRRCVWAQTPPATPSGPRPVAASPAIPSAAPAAPPSPPAPAAPSAVAPASSPSLPNLALSNPPNAGVRIEMFGPERGYIVGVETVGLLCVVRNGGQAALPADVLRLRCYPISGLDYTSGNLLPVLPSLAPGQAVAYRWRLAPTDAKMVLAAGVALERIEGVRGRGGEGETLEGTGKKEQGSGNPIAASAQAAGSRQQAANNSSEALPLSPPPSVSLSPSLFSPPLLAFTIIPRLSRTPGFGDVPVLKDALPHADTREGVAVLLNNRVGARVQIGPGRDPLMQLAVRDAGGWRVLASTLPLLRANVGEDGQIPWWQSFRCQSARVREDKDSATLTLTGTLGSACGVEILLEARPDTCVLSGRARLTAMRALRLSGVQLPSLLAGMDDKTLSAPRQDGSPSLLADASSPLPDDARIAASHGGAVTFGIAWPANPPRAGWRWTRLPAADGAYTLNLGVQALSGMDGDLVSAGSSVDFTFRLFAFAPSDTARDALRFQIP